MEKTLVVVGKPSKFSLELLKQLPFCISVYDAMDDFPAFHEGIARSSLIQTETNLIQRVSLVLSSSRVLQHKWLAIRNDIRLVLNGFEPKEKVSPERAPKTAGPFVFGYIGTIAQWFDWELVIALANSRPLDCVRLIGPIYSRPSLQLPPNIELLPACTHEDALKKMQDFDVGLIPFLVTQLTDSVDPIKYYEYRSYGLPVVSTAFGEMRNRYDDEGVFICDSRSNIEDCLTKALMHRQSPQEENFFRAQNCWNHRFDASGVLALGELNHILSQAP